MDSANSSTRNGLRLGGEFAMNPKRSPRDCRQAFLSGLPHAFARTRSHGIFGFPVAQRIDDAYTYRSF